MCVGGGGGEVTILTVFCCSLLCNGLHAPVHRNSAYKSKSLLPGHYIDWIHSLRFDVTNSPVSIVHNFNKPYE